MKRFACQDIIPGCAHVFTGADDQSVLDQVIAHAADDHGLVKPPLALVELVVATTHTFTPARPRGHLRLVGADPRTTDVVTDDVPLTQTRCRRRRPQRGVPDLSAERIAPAIPFQRRGESPPWNGRRRAGTTAGHAAPRSPTATATGRGRSTDLPARMCRSTAAPTGSSPQVVPVHPGRPGARPAGHGGRRRASADAQCGTLWAMTPSGSSCWTWPNSAATRPASSRPGVTSSPEPTAGRSVASANRSGPAGGPPRSSNANCTRHCSTSPSTRTPRCG